MGTNRSGNDLKNKFNAMERRVASMKKRNKSFSADELAGPAAALIAYVTELNATGRSSDSQPQQPQRQRRQPRAVSEDSDSDYNSEESAPCPQRPRRNQRRAVVELALQASQLAVDDTQPVMHPWFFDFDQPFAEHGPHDAFGNDALPDDILSDLGSFMSSEFDL